MSLALALKMLAVAGVVVCATMVAERSRPAVAALIATLPLSVGATFVIVALDHDAAFVSAAALRSIAGATATTVFITAFALAAGRGLRLWPALGCAYIAWLPATLVVYFADWTALSAVAFAAVLTAIGLVVTAPLRQTSAPSNARRFWYDPLVRAASVVALVGAITGLSDRLGTVGVGTFANYPIIMTSVGVILYLRLGAATVARVMAYSIPGMIGVCLGLLHLHLTAEAWGKPAALLSALLICICWNFALYNVDRVSRAKSASADTAPQAHP